jgi:nucleotide-binding universal stress UspA family protein
MNAGAERLTLPKAQPERLLARLIVATDGSENGDRAVAFAVTLALQHESTLEICYALDRGAAIAECCSPYSNTNAIEPLVTSLDEMAGAILAKAKDLATAAGLRATTCVIDGSPVSAIVEREKSHGCDAIVIGTQGKRGVARAILGSTADGVLRRAEVPVFVIPPTNGAPVAPLASLFVAVDDSDPSDAAVDFAIAFARVQKAQLIFCGVADTEYLRSNAAAYAFEPGPMLAEMHEAVMTTVTAAADRAREGGLRCEAIVVDGSPASVIPTIAESHHARAIVIGTHGRRGLRRWLVGSVAESVVQNSSIPVVVIRGPAHDRIRI